MEYYTLKTLIPVWESLKPGRITIKSYHRGRQWILFLECSSPAFGFPTPHPIPISHFGSFKEAINFSSLIIKSFKAYREEKLNV